MGLNTNASVLFSSGYIIELTWDIPESSGPGVSDPNCISYAYYSNVDFVKVGVLFIDLSPASNFHYHFLHFQDLYSGLLGPLVICRPGTLRGEGSDRQRADVDKEFALLFMVHDENHSWYLEDNIREYLNVDPDSLMLDEGFEESNMMHGETYDHR